MLALRLFDHLPCARPAALASATLVLALAGCGTAHIVHVNALNDPSAAPFAGTYEVRPGASDLSATDLQFREVVARLQPALARRGYQPAAPGRPADTVLFVSYGVGPPRTLVYTSSFPVYAETGGGTRTVTTTTRGPDGNPVTTTTTIREPGTIQRVGSDVTTTSVTQFRKHLRLSARPAGVEPERNPELWAIEVVSDDERADLRAVLPAMIVAATPWIGGNTGQAIQVRIRPNDPRLQFPGEF